MPCRTFYIPGQYPGIVAYRSMAGVWQENTVPTVPKRPGANVTTATGHSFGLVLTAVRDGSVPDGNVPSV
jgi:hypothetical protein